MRRITDVVLALAITILLTPVLFTVMAVIWYDLGPPVLFRQRRIGKNGASFTLIKFRTMRIATYSDGELLPDAKRLTNTGRFLRRFSLDELPELWNVIRGDMSLIGPRPLLPQRLSHLTATQQSRHNIKPGITGWAQVNGRDRLSRQEKFAHDVWYRKNRSLLLDMRILWLTLWRVIKSDGVASRAKQQANQDSKSNSAR